jgi:hypothetical protein
MMQACRDLGVEVIAEGVETAGAPICDATVLNARPLTTPHTRVIIRPVFAH